MSALDELKGIAIKLQIDPIRTTGHAARVETIVKVLSDLNKSYLNFLEVEFLKNDDFKKVIDTNENIIDTIKEQLALLVVDLKFSSFEASLAPDVSETVSPLFKNEVLVWEKETFGSYKSLLFDDFQDPNYIKRIANRYNEEERLKIYQPIFSSMGDGKNYNINLKDNKGKIIRRLTTPDQNKINFFLPKARKKPTDVQHKTVQAYLKVKTTGGKVDINKRNFKQVYYWEEMEHETYPFKPNILSFGDIAFVLNSKLDCDVKFQEGNYVISCEDLDIEVWGETRDKAEEAFGFGFYSLYENYYKEVDKNLSSKAIKLKTKLKKLIKTVLNEE